MCGIVGIYSEQVSQALLRSMGDAISHRGPDDSGEWQHASLPLGFGFRRLSILDLSPEGHQPMLSRSGRFTIVFNGEIYNFRSLKEELSHVPFRGGSDTEVILAAFESWGVVRSLQKMSGMFAIAVWDESERTLTLARDRIGKKPLYYSLSNSSLLFASELKAFHRVPGFQNRTSREGLSEMLQRGYIPSPLSIYQDVYKLPPGCFLSLRDSDLAQIPDFSPYPDEGKLSPKSYWSIRSLSRRPRFSGSKEEALVTIRSLFERAVRERMIADVPLGAFLSGGVDSSLVVAAMQAQSARPVKTFTIGFQEAEYNEAPFAAKIAQHLGTEHSETILSADDSLKLIPRLSEMFCEPLADASQLPTFLVSEVARKDVTVAINGDGGDELFIGYNRYTYSQDIFRVLGQVPRPLRQGSAAILSQLPQSLLTGVVSQLVQLLPASRRPGRPGEAIQKLLRVLDARDSMELYDRISRYWPTEILRGGGDTRGSFLKMSDLDPSRTALEKILLSELGNYLVEDLLVKVDRASMAASLEARSPLLDYELVEFVSSLPTELRAPGGDKKALLRELLAQYLPREMTERPKMGFSVPIGRWLRAELRDWAEDRLNVLRSRCGDVLDLKLIDARWNAHQRGEAEFGNELWCLCVAGDWFARWKATLS